MDELDHVRTNIAAYWNERGATYDDDPDHRVRDRREHAAWLAALRELLPVPPAKVLDVGTGTGFLALLLAELGHGVVGVDLAARMLAIARAKAKHLAQPPSSWSATPSCRPSRAAAWMASSAAICSGPCPTRRWPWATGGIACGQAGAW